MIARFRSPGNSFSKKLPEPHHDLPAGVRLLRRVDGLRSATQALFDAPQELCVQRVVPREVLARPLSVEQVLLSVAVC